MEKIRDKKSEKMKDNITMALLLGPPGGLLLASFDPSPVPLFMSMFGALTCVGGVTYKVNQKYYKEMESLEKEVENLD